METTTTQTKAPKLHKVATREACDDCGYKTDRRVRGYYGWLARCVSCHRSRYGKVS